MKIYISGKISGLDYDLAFQMFEQAEAHLTSLGLTPVNPMRSEGEIPGKEWAEYIAEDILILDKCDAIYMLPNWQESDGARIEHNFCMVRGKKIYYTASEMPYDAVASAQVVSAADTTP